MIIAAVGVVALSRFDIAAGFTVGDALVLAASAAAAGYVVLAARVVRAEDPVLVTTIQFSFAALLTIMVTSVLWATGAARVPTGVPVRYWIVAVIIGGLGYAGSFVLYNHALRIVSASTAGVVLNLVPVIGVLSAGVLLGEALTVWQLIGTLLVTAGVFLAPVGSSGPRRPRELVDDHVQHDRRRRSGHRLAGDRPQPDRRPGHGAVGAGSRGSDCWS